MKISIDVQMESTKDLITAILRHDGVKRGLKSAGLYLKGKLGEYPAQPNYVSYKRTGNLRNRWSTKSENGGLTVRIGNNASYADDVQGRQKNPYFKQVWGSHSIKSVTNRERARVGQIVANEMRRVIK
jgi:hypothetical protein